MFVKNSSPENIKNRFTSPEAIKERYLWLNAHITKFENIPAKFVDEKSNYETKQFLITHLSSDLTSLKCQYKKHHFDSLDSVAEYFCNSDRVESKTLKRELKSGNIRQNIQLFINSNSDLTGARKWKPFDGAIPKKIQLSCWDYEAEKNDQLSEQPKKASKTTNEDSPSSQIQAISGKLEDLSKDKPVHLPADQDLLALRANLHHFIVTVPPKDLSEFAKKVMAVSEEMTTIPKPAEEIPKPIASDLSSPVTSTSNSDIEKSKEIEIT